MVTQRLTIDEATPAQPDQVVWAPTEISVSNFRGLQEVAFETNAAVTLLVGPNGAGKTSILEAMEFLHTGAVLDARGKTLNQAEYLPDADATPQISARYADPTGVRQGPNEDLAHVIRRTVNPHKVAVNAWEGGARDADLQLYRAMEWDTDRLPTLMQADRFPRMTQSEQAEFLADWVRGGREVNLAAHAQDELQRSIARSIAENVSGFGGNDRFEVALARIGERRTAAHNAVKQAEENLAEQRGAYDEALAEVREAGYEGELEEVAEELQADADVTREALAEVRNDLQARQAAEADIERWQEASQQAQADLEAAREELAGADEQAEKIVAARDQAESDVASTREELEHWRERAQEANEEVQRLVSATASAEHASHRIDAEVVRWQELLEAGECPTCKQELNEDVVGVYEEKQFEAGQAASLVDHKRGELKAAELAYQDACGYRQNAEDIYESARNDLADLPTPPDADAIRARVETLQGRIDDLAEKSEAARETLAQYPDDLAETVETLQDALSQHRATVATIDRARGHQGRIEDCAQEVEAHKAERRACDRLKRAWQDAQATQMSGNPALEALLDEVNAILMPTRGWQAGWTEDGPVVVGAGFSRELSRLSDGERLTVGAAWQAAMARRVGLGLCMIDHAAEIDDEAFAEFVGACAEIGQITGVRFLIARPDAGRVTEQGADIIMLRNGWRVGNAD